MSAPQTQAVAVIGAGEARFDGAGAIITLGTSGTNPTWTSLASNAIWKALFASPLSGPTWAGAGSMQYITNADFYVGGTGASCFVTKVDSPTNAPTAANGFEWPLGYSESIRNCPEMLRSMQIYVPANTKLYVALYWGGL